MGHCCSRYRNKLFSWVCVWLWVVGGRYVSKDQYPAVFVVGQGLESLFVVCVGSGGDCGVDLI